MNVRPTLLAALLVLTACGTSPATPASSTPPKAKPITAAVAAPARAYIEAATAEARTAAPDARLLRVDSQRGADFDAHTPDGKAPHWIYTFGSAAKKQELTVTASSLAVKLLGEGTDAAIDAATVLPDGWADSVQAFEAAQENGGKDYLATRQNTPVSLSLAYDQRLKKPLWTLRYSSNPTAGLYFLLVDGVSGAFVEKQEIAADPTAR